MANIFLTPNRSRFLQFPSAGDYIDVVSWPAAPSSTAFSSIPADTLLVMPFMAGYLLDFDALNYITTGTANINWGLYTYNPFNRAGSLLATTGQVAISGSTITRVTTLPIARIFPGRTYALALNSSASWTMLVLSGNGAGCSKILGGEYVGGNFQNYTHLRTSLTYSATMPATLPSLTKSNAIWPPNPLLSSI